MKARKMLEIKYNLKNKFKVIKMSKKRNRTIKITNNNKMIFKWKGNFKAKCTINRNPKINKMKESKNKFQTNRWDKWMMRIDKKISKIKKVRLKEKVKLTLTSKGKNRESLN
jgi:hypothetical protein